MKRSHTNVLVMALQNGDKMEPPVRICCGQRHFGPVCPDGNVMCCVCFNRVPQSELNELPNGKKEDVCKTCAEKERIILEAKSK